MEHVLRQTEQTALSFENVFRYWLPEVASMACLVVLPVIVDLLFVSKLKSTAIYSTIGMSANLIYTLVKVAEALSVAGIAIIGRLNGAKKSQECDRAFADILIATGILGLLQLVLVIAYANKFMHWMEAPPEIISLAVPFLQLQAVATFFVFVFMACSSFFKAVQDTKTPFFINIAGILTFLFFDYALIFGKCGFAPHGYLGSAIASIIRYCCMVLLSGCVFLLHSRYQTFRNSWPNISVNLNNIWAVLQMSIPIILDKATIAFVYIWLAKMVAPLGTCAIASVDAVKHLERIAFIPAMAFAQITTFIVSNNIGQGNVAMAKANIKRILKLSLIIVSIALLTLCFFGQTLMHLVDHQKNFTAIACTVQRVICVFLLLDLTQIIFSAALRGAGDVHTVMLTRLGACFGFFFPVSFALRTYVNCAAEYKIILIFMCFYVTTGIMSLILFLRLRGNAWHQIKISGYAKASKQIKVKPAILQSKKIKRVEKFTQV